MFVLFTFMNMSIILSLLLLVIYSLISYSVMNSKLEKNPFECGFSIMESSKTVFSLDFFLITLVFLVFDVELILFFPFVMFSKSLPESGLLYVNLVLLIVTLGYIWEWTKAGLEWT